MKRTATYAVASLALLCFAPEVHAHPFHGGDGFAAGLAHPFLGVDHLFAAIAVGLWAAELGRRAAAAVLTAFAGAMSLGAVLAFAGQPLPLVEAGLAASVLVLGLLVAFAARLPVAAGLAIASVFALLHGHAHATEMPANALAWIYGAGVLAATACLGAGAFLAGVLLRERAVQFGGALVALTGVALLSG